jgi:hypothetical protein
MKGDRGAVAFGAGHVFHGIGAGAFRFPKNSGGCARFLGQQSNAVCDHKRRVKAYAELTDQFRVIFNFLAHLKK